MNIDDYIFFVIPKSQRNHRRKFMVQTPISGVFSWHVPLCDDVAKSWGRKVLKGGDEGNEHQDAHDDEKGDPDATT